MCLTSLYTQIYLWVIIISKETLYCFGWNFSDCLEKFLFINTFDWITIFRDDLIVENLIEVIGIIVFVWIISVLEYSIIKNVRFIDTAIFIIVCVIKKSFDFKFIFVIMGTFFTIFTETTFSSAREVIRNQWWLRTFSRSRFLSDIKYEIIVPIIFDVVENFECSIDLDHKIYWRENYTQNESCQETTKCNKTHSRS